MTATPWIQAYDPLGSPWLSTAAAAFPIVLLLVALGLLEWRAHLAALAGLTAAVAVSVFVFGMPLPTAAATAIYGALYAITGSTRISWISLGVNLLIGLWAGRRLGIAPLFEFRDGRIGVVKEYGDTAHARDIFGTLEL